MGKTMQWWAALGLALAGLGASSRAAGADAQSADSTEPGGSGKKYIGILGGAKVGGIVPFGGLGANVTGGVELGYVFPWLHRSFALAVDLDYTVPKTSGTESDPRVSGGKYTWHLTEQELDLM